MLETVTVTETQGTRYTWASAGFTWSSASAGKSWTAAYPAVYGIAVAATLAFVQAGSRSWTKRSSESLPISEGRKNIFTLRESESVGFSETYSDLIAFVLRWVESMAFAQGVSKSNKKQIAQSFQAADYLAHALTKSSNESLAWSESLRQNSIKRLAEVMPVSESIQKLIVKNRSESFGLGDDLDRVITKQVAEAIAFAETYTDLIAFVLRVSEGLGISDLGAKQIRKPLSESFGTSDKVARQSIKRVAEAVAIGEALGKTVAYRRNLTDGFGVSDALRKAMRLTAREALLLAEQYRRHANGVISDMIVASGEITEDDFAAIVQSGHPPGYTDFRDFIQGDYTYRRALFRAILNARNSDRGFIDALRVTVDVPDIFDRGTAQITEAAVGVAITFTRTFRVAPEVTMTHKGGAVVAIARLVGSITTGGFTALLENTSGTRVAGSFTWIAQGY